MSIETKQITGNNTNLELLRLAIDKACAISCLFLLIALTLFIFNQVKLAKVDPQENPLIESLVLELEKSPKDANLKQRIRNTDKDIRKEYFQRTNFSTKGRYVILFACVLALLTSGSAFAIRSTPKTGLETVQPHSITINKATLGTLAAAILFLLALTANAIFKPLDLSAEYSKILTEEAGKTVSETKGAKITPTVTASAPPTAPKATNYSPEPKPVPPRLPAAVGDIAVPSEETPEEPEENASTSAMGMMGGMPGPASSSPSPAKPQLPAVQLFDYDPDDYAPSIDEWNANWPIFRGPNGYGVIPNIDYPIKWNAAKGDNLIWKADVPLPGWNSPVVWDDKVFVTGADANQRAIYCFDTTDGKLVWSDKLESIVPDSQTPQILEDTGYAASTAATDGKRVFSVFANGDLFCHDYEGNLLWNRALETPINIYGHASSLAIYKNLLIVLYDQDSSAEDGMSAIYGIQAKDGAVVWRTLRPVPNSWTTPLVLFQQSQDMIITSANPWTISYQPLTGDEIWRVKAVTGDVAPSIAYYDNRIFVTNTGSYLYGIDINGTGDLTNTNIAWKMYENLPDISSPVADNGLLYMTTSDGTFSCIDTSDGAILYEHDLDVTINSSPIIVGKRVYMLDSQGTMHIIPVSKTFSEESIGIVPDRTLATPAFANGHIYIRGSKTLFCIGNK